jgi:hypothetical protein
VIATGWIFIKFDVGDSYENQLRNSSLVQIGEKFWALDMKA